MNPRTTTNPSDIINRTRATRTRRLVPATMAIVLGITTAACGGDDDSATATTSAPATTGAPETTAVPETTAAPTAPDATDGGEVVTVALSDFAFGGLPDRVPVGTRIEIENISDGEMHELVAIRIPDGEDRSVEALLALPEEELDEIFGETMPAMVLLAPPGGPQIDAVGDGTFTEPGRYAVVCFIPTGVDPAAFMAAAEEGGDGPPDIDGGPPHIVHGMHAEVVVE